MIKFVCILLSFCIVTGCATRYASGDSRMYLKSKNGERLVVPPPLSSGEISTFYDLPPQPNNATVSIQPPKQ